MTNTTRFFVACVTALVTHALGAGVAAAQEPTGLSFRLEAGAGTMLTDHQVQRLGYGAAQVAGTVRVSYSALDALSLQLSVGYWHFFASGGTDGFVSPLTLGARLEPHLGDFVRPYLDVNGGVAFTGPLVRPVVDAGVGLELDVAPELGVGPMARFGLVVEPDEANVYPDDAIYWVAGVSATVRPWPARDLDEDPDHDGVRGPADRCPTEPEDVDAFDDQDGCPDADDDADGISDRDDACRLVAENVNGVLDTDGCPDEDDDPDRDGVRGDADRCPGDAEDRDGHRDEDGCPELDDDGDGILDTADSCPREAETRNGLEDTDGCPDELPYDEPQLLPPLLEPELEPPQLLPPALPPVDWADTVDPSASQKAAIQPSAALARVNSERNELSIPTRVMRRVSHEPTRSGRSALSPRGCPRRARRGARRSAGARPHRARSRTSSRSAT